MPDSLNIPLELAELLYATLGPLAEVLAAEGHSWASLVKRVLDAYAMGRDHKLVERYGLGVVGEAKVCTTNAIEALVSLVNELTDEDIDFDMWANEIQGIRE